MKLFYITLNTDIEAEKISYDLLNDNIAVCTNWFPIQCAYRMNDEIKQDKEVVLIVKTQDNMSEVIERYVQQHIAYTNFIAEIDVHSVNLHFADWLNRIVPMQK